MTARSKGTLLLTYKIVQLSQKKRESRKKMTFDPSIIPIHFLGKKIALRPKDCLSYDGETSHESFQEGKEHSPYLQN